MKIRRIADVKDRLEILLQEEHQATEAVYVNIAIQDFYRDVLEAVAKGQSHAPTLAKEALKAEAIAKRVGRPL